MNNSHNAMQMAMNPPSNTPSAVSGPNLAHYKDACYQNGLKVAGQAVAAEMRGDIGMAALLTTRARSLLGLPPTPSAT